MGQVRSVQVHRLLVANSVDQRMLEILDGKSRLFDEYARRSAIADSSPEAIDISEASLARTVVEQEPASPGCGSRRDTSATKSPSNTQPDPPNH